MHVWILVELSSYQGDESSLEPHSHFQRITLPTRMEHLKHMKPKQTKKQSYQTIKLHTVHIEQKMLLFPQFMNKLA